LKASHHPDYFLPLPDGHPFPMAKYPLVRERLRAGGWLRAEDELVPEEAAYEDLARVHTTGYLDRLFGDGLDAAEVRALGVPWTPRLLRRSRLAVQVVSVAGPAGGSFAFWEGDGESDLGNVTFSVPVGETNGTNFLVVSENNSEPGADPYGHIHGREFTTSLPGTYTVGLRVIDLSTNGLNGGPIHAPSDILFVRFQAGVRIESIQLFTNRVTVSFRCPPGISNVLEANGLIAPANWQTVAGPVRGNNNLQTLSETNPPTSNRLYRIRHLNNLP
jgi:hypothetical protein